MDLRGPGRSLCSWPQSQPPQSVTVTSCSGRGPGTGTEEGRRVNRGRTWKATGRAISVQARHGLQSRARHDKERLRDGEQPTARRNRPTGGLGGPSVAQALAPQDRSGPQFPSRPQAGGSLGGGRHRAGTTPLPPSANSCRCDHQLCSTLPDTQRGCTHREKCVTGQSTDGPGSQQSTRPRVGNQGTEGTGTRQVHGKETGCAPPPRHRTTRGSSPSALLQDKGQGSMTLGPGARPGSAT